MANVGGWMRSYDDHIDPIVQQLSPIFKSILKLEEAKASTSDKQQQKRQAVISCDQN